jgi:hypothetical protein
MTDMQLWKKMRENDKISIVSEKVRSLITHEVHPRYFLGKPERIKK